ncbi:MAG: Ig-like domain-containing protein, partial [Gemmatimonadetes bacterium]|nr:Ig-like domain-containing protein [Gemmatimonadota bacterium]
LWSTPRPEYGVVTSPSVTDAQGQASARWTLGTLAGTQVAQAQVPDVGMTVGFDGNVTAGAPSRLYVVPGDVGYVAQAGDVIDVRYTVADQYGNRVPGATVTVAPSHGSASPTTGQTDADGYLHVAWTLAPIHLEGANFVRAVMTATSPGTQADARTPLATSVTVRHGPVATIVIIPDERTAAADQPVTFFLGLRDAYGNRFSLDEFAGCTIQWSAPPPAQLTPGRGSLAQQLEIRSTSSVTVAATCGSASDTAELIIQ